MTIDFNEGPITIETIRNARRALDELLSRPVDTRTVLPAWLYDRAAAEGHFMGSFVRLPERLGK